MTDSPALALKQVIGDCLQWMDASGYSHETCSTYQSELSKFLHFIVRKQIDWDDIFTLDTLKAFQKSGQSAKAPAVKRLFRYLVEQKIIHRSIGPQRQRLPDLYENYLSYYGQTHQVPSVKIIRISRVLRAFHDYLEKHNIKLTSIRIEHIDTFLAEFFIDFSPNTRQKYRFYLRGFIKYLYYPGGVIAKDLAPFVIEPRKFAKSIPPKFFRPHEIQRLFDSFDLSSVKDMRNHVMVHLSYGLGLRPHEISLITLDDISFTKSELILTTRKNGHPITLPIPENILKAIAAYIIGSRPKSRYRRLFLNLVAPYRPISASLAGMHITQCIQKAGLPGTAYWLRHTYAQNLLEAGASIYEIKEMLGHDYIDSTEKYLHVHTKLMRKVIFDEKF